MSKTVLGVFWTNWSSEFFQKHPKVFCIYLSNQISLRGRFVLKTNSMISSITSWVIPCQTTRQKLQHQKNVFFGLISVTYILNCQIRLFISVLLGLMVNFSQILSFLAFDMFFPRSFNIFKFKWPKTNTIWPFVVGILPFKYI